MSRLEPGQTAPAWTLPDAQGQPVSLSDFAGRKVVIYVYPAAMTPGCTTQACDFRDNEAVFAKHGYAVVGVSPATGDTSCTHRGHAVHAPGTRPARTGDTSCTRLVSRRRRCRSPW